CARVRGWYLGYFDYW
nr:immunoglobulin heavy chain junction region [Macaca mulatta]MOX59761.1 immunoglobulin heavy chain junction region [Macaca mulatta]MOX59855.1 immunoglobulin heavy chain junction region [Macaca mulatta]MOX60111.1 immunoglobulin heavy chain junction region [Macaca mulatta]MOX66350.1 immunoglobulin heavy chain junction region [Macaca mulatta]